MTNILLSITDGTTGQGWGMLTVIFLVFLLSLLLVGYIALKLFRWLNKLTENGKS
jgi:hypothetical protein